MVVNSKTNHLNQQVSQDIPFTILHHHVRRHVSLFSVLPYLLNYLARLAVLLMPLVTADAGEFTPAYLTRAWVHQLLSIIVPVIS